MEALKNSVIISSEKEALDIKNNQPQIFQAIKDAQQLLVNILSNSNNKEEVVKAIGIAYLVIPQELADPLIAAAKKRLHINLSDIYPQPSQPKNHPHYKVHCNDSSWSCLKQVLLFIDKPRLGKNPLQGKAKAIAIYQTLIKLHNRTLAAKAFLSYRIETYKLLDKAQLEKLSQLFTQGNIYDQNIRLANNNIHYLLEHN